MDDASDFDFDEQLAFEDDHMQAMENPVLLPPSEDKAEEAAPVLLPLQVAAPEEPVIVAEADVAARSPSPQLQEEVESSPPKRTCLVFELSLSHTVWRIAQAIAMSRPDQGPACIAILEVELVGGAFIGAAGLESKQWFSWQWTSGWVEQWSQHHLHW